MVGGGKGWVGYERGGFSGGEGRVQWWGGVGRDKIWVGVG